MHYAAANGNVQALQMLLAKGADVNVKNSAGETPLIKACQFIELDAIEFLIEYQGIDILAKDVVSCTIFNHSNSILEWKESL